MSLFYSERELVDLTGNVLPSKQIKWLKENNIRFIINGSKKPVVFKTQVEDSTNDDDGLLTRVQIIRRSKPVKPLCGIYFLLCGSEIVYVGQSINLVERIGNHLRNDEMLFDSYYYLEVKRENMLLMERKYIEKLFPRMNKKKLKKGLKPNLCGQLIVEWRNVPQKSFLNGLFIS
ncbi:MAG: DUF4224 domain-containing protein [Nitrosomonas sp.]|uniref:DUF4224 domain-containing protein n=1 Tax=Nitrosomonas sp. TaxID=42353 RepID=UPI0025FB3B31|nr:DUF4224 domain-containing protein [Nitrosomonas sp.]MBY0474234.1 DUF4224 domain-containing protein [Nitrosomonas sp.]